MKKFIPLVIVFILLALVAYLGLVNVSAKGRHEEVCFCHNVNHNPHTICTDDRGQIEGHFRHVRNGNDYLGECKVEPSVTPTVTPTITPTVTPEPTTTPEPTVTPTEEPKQNPIGGSAEAPVCNDEKPKYAPTVTYAWRTGTDALVKWTTTDTDEFIVFYGLTGKELNWNTGRVKGQETTIHKVYSMIDVMACSVSKCGQLNCGAAVADP